MKRTIKKQIWMTKAEAQDLQKKAKKACMTEARLMRMLLEGYNPPEAPDERFYDAMNEMRLASERLEDVSRNIDDPEKKDMYMNAAYSLLKLQSELEKKYLMPKESDFKWQ